MYESGKAGTTVEGGGVLLADSHQDMVEGIRSLLGKMLEGVVMVADEPSLLETAEALNPDVVVTDLSLPKAPGVNWAITKFDP